MYHAYIKADPLENSEAISNLAERLANQGISYALTDKDWKEIISPQPFLYFRNAYLRFEEEKEVLNFHWCNPQIPFVKTLDGELISASTLAKEIVPFVAYRRVYFHQPNVSPLPILLGTHCRPEYFQLTLNSILYNCKQFIQPQKLYLVLSQPDSKTLQIVERLLQEAPIEIEAVLSENNLKYAFANFGSKFFKLEKFIHFEDDGILPENLHYHVPFWTNQLNYRSGTADLVGLKISEENWESSFYRCDVMYQNGRTNIPTNNLWHYEKQNFRKIMPFGGLGLVIDSAKAYRDFTAPNYCTSDTNIYKNAQSLCLLNTPVYHLGAHLKMDYPELAEKKRTIKNQMVEKFQLGKNLRTGETREIDLSLNWIDSV